VVDDAVGPPVPDRDSAPHRGRLGQAFPVAEAAGHGECLAHDPLRLLRLATAQQVGCEGHQEGVPLALGVAGLALSPHLQEAERSTSEVGRLRMGKAGAGRVGREGRVGDGRLGPGDGHGLEVVVREPSHVDGGAMAAGLQRQRDPVVEAGRLDPAESGEQGLPDERVVEAPLPAWLALDDDSGADRGLERDEDGLGIHTPGGLEQGKVVLLAGHRPETQQGEGRLRQGVEPPPEDLADGGRQRRNRHEAVAGGGGRRSLGPDEAGELADEERVALGPGVDLVSELCAFGSQSGLEQLADAVLAESGHAQAQRPGLPGEPREALLHRLWQGLTDAAHGHDDEDPHALEV
jgi:hypothetical protein